MNVVNNLEGSVLCCVQHESAESYSPLLGRKHTIDEGKLAEQDKELTLRKERMAK